MALRHRRRGLLVAAAAGAALATTVASAGTAFAGGKAPVASRHQISPASAWAQHATPAGLVPANQSVHVKVWLSPRNPGALARLVAAVSDPGSANYGHYLTQSQYMAQFAPTASQVAAVQSWLTGAGLTVEGVGPDNHFVAVAGAPAAVNRAFDTTLQLFKVNGTTSIAPTSPVSAPTSVSASVAAVTGLDTLAHWVHTNIEGAQDQGDHTNNGHRVNLGPTGGFANATPCSSYYGAASTDGVVPPFNGEQLPFAVCGYTPSQLRNAYGVTESGKTGKGVTVAITDAFVSQTLQKDADTYAVRHGDSAFAKGQFTNEAVHGYDPQRVADCGGNGWYGEQTLDVEAVHAMAPDAGVAYYGAASCYDDDFLAAMAAVVHDNQASIVSNSWGEPTYVKVDGAIFPTIDAALVSAYEDVLMQGAAQGIGFYFSSGDDGDENDSYGVVQSDWPTSDRYITSVGGTSVGIGADGTRTFETGWGTHKYSLSADGTSWDSVGFLYGAGGGCWAPTATSDPVSAQVISGLQPFFAKPTWQTVDTSCGEYRGVPDISAIADPTTGMLVGETQNFGLSSVWGKGVKYGEYRIGGTSLASPVIAGVEAVAQQGGQRIGFANPSIYKAADTVMDVTSVKPDSGNIRVDYANGYNASDGLLYSVRTFDEDSSLATGAGWDNVSGIGSPTAGFIAKMHELVNP